MLLLKRLLTAALILLVAAFTMAFTLENREEVQLQFMTLQSPQLPLAIIVIAGFILGGCAGIFLGLLGNARLFLRSRGELRRARAECERLRRELAARS